MPDDVRFGPEQDWTPAYTDDASVSSWEVGDVLPFASGSHDSFRIARIDPPAAGSSDILGCVHLVPNNEA